jgi:hypothetical protein
MARTFIHGARSLAILGALAMALSACALSRSEVAIKAPEVTAAAAGATPVKIVRIQDSREFSEAPPDPSMPSLKNSAQIADAKITARAIARKRNSYGMALGDVLLQEGTSVPDLVRKATVKALQDKGYVVVDETSPDAARALPLSIDIGEFWAWGTPGLVEVTVEFKGSVGMTGDMIQGAAPVKAYAKYGSAAIFESTWIFIVEKGVGDLTDKIKERIKAPSELSAKTS